MTDGIIDKRGFVPRRLRAASADVESISSPDEFDRIEIDIPLLDDTHQPLWKEHPDPRYDVACVLIRSGVWLDTATVAIMLGVSTSRARQLTRRDRLPHVERGGRHWFRRSHIEQIAAARAQRSGPQDGGPLAHPRGEAALLAST